MDIAFPAALQQLGPHFALRLIREARPPANYVFSRLLPDTPIASYSVEGGSMTVRTTMAGLVGMDSPYPEGGLMDVSTFLERAAKTALAVELPEVAIRHLQAFVAAQTLTGGNGTQALIDETLRFTDGILVQSQLDTAEWMRGSVLATGMLTWTFNGLSLAIDYGVPAANKLTKRTGNDAYGGSASKFWTDVYTQATMLGTVAYRFVSAATAQKILTNPVNSAVLTAQQGTTWTIRRLNAQSQFTSDVRDTVNLIVIDQSGEVIVQNPTAGLPPTTVKVPFFADNVMSAVGLPSQRRYTVASGSQPLDAQTLGYLHLAPTVEGGLVPGRWARVFVPQDRPWALRGETVANQLPVLTAPELLVIAATD